MQVGMSMIGVAAVLIGTFATFAERRRARRTDLDRVGFMPWPLIVVLATLIALFAFAIAIAQGVRG